MKKNIPPVIRKHLPKLLFIPPVVVGAVILAILIQNRLPPQREPEQEVARVLRVIKAPLQAIVPRAIGYGTAEPGNIWQAIAEVKGRVIEVHPDLSAGSIIKKDSVVLKIDPAEYELAVAQLNATISQTVAQLDELAVKKTNDQASLTIERDSLSLAESELERLRGLFERNAISTSEIEQQQRNVLLQRQKVQSLTNSLNLFPSTTKSIEANLAVQQAKLQQAKLDQQKTVLRAPFDCRIGPVFIEVDQFLATGQTLFEAHNVDSIEVEAHVAPQYVRKLLQNPNNGQPLDLNMRTMREVFKIDAIVRYKYGDREIEWPARFERVRENIDPETRTLGIVFAIDDPYTRAIPGQRPPPVRGTFCEVELRSQKQIEQVIIPRTALHDGHVYLVDGDQRLLRRAVEVSFAQSGFVAIKAGLQENDIVVVSDPTPAVEGMLVKAVHDDDLRQRLIDAAAGKGTVK